MTTLLTIREPTSYIYDVEEFEGLMAAQRDVTEGVCGGGGVGWRWYMRWVALSHRRMPVGTQVHRVRETPLNEI